MIDDARAAANRQARSERKAAHLRSLFERHVAAFSACAEPGAPQAARDMHAALDAVLERERMLPTGGEVRCRPGCNHCCHGPVEVSPGEAALLVEAARAAGVTLDPARLAGQARYGADNWREQSRPGRACVFLGGGGTCSVYDARPNACRKLLVTSDPEFCDTDRHPSGSVVRLLSGEAEMLSAAALAAFGGDLMPRALLAALGRADAADPA